MSYKSYNTVCCMHEGSADISADFLLFEFWGEQVIMLPTSMVPKHFDCAQLIAKNFEHTPQYYV